MIDLESSQLWCARVMRAHAKSFYFSTRILPRRKREAVEALYGLFRSADDLADEPGFTREERERGLARILDELATVRVSGAHGSEPWYPAVRRAFERFPIDPADARRLIEGCRSDLDPAPIRTLADLYAYSAAVAGTVGRCSMPILGASDADSLERGERLGIAMQYTNVLRDVDEDRALGRSYLPSEMLARADERAVMREIAAAARTYYREGRVLAARVPNDGSRAALLMTSEIYGGIVDRLEARDFDASRGRAYVSTGEKLRRALRCVVEAYTGFATIR